MTIEAVWFLIVGALMVLMALGRKLVERLPMTGAMVYFIVGFLLGPACAGLLTIDVERDVRLLRTLTEAGLVVSLFAIGMYLRVELSRPLWRLTLRLAGPTMLITIAVMFVAARWGLGLAAGPALLLASALAPTGASRKLATMNRCASLCPQRAESTTVRPLRWSTLLSRFAESAVWAAEIRGRLPLPSRGDWRAHSSSAGRWARVSSCW